MKIIVIADTHVKSGSIKETLPAELTKMIKQADLVVHAGDFVTKEAYDELSGICALIAVHGNMDEMSLKKILPEKRFFKADTIRIGVIHEAALSIHDTTGAWYMAKEMKVDVLVFGHIHKPVIEKSDVLLICPGSPTAPRLSEPSAIELTIMDGNIDGKVIALQGTRCSSLNVLKDFER